MSAEFQETAGEVVKRALSERSMKHLVFARDLDAASSTLSKWLNGTRVPPEKVQEQIDTLLDLDLSGTWGLSSSPSTVFVSAPGQGLRSKDRAEHRDQVLKVVTAIDKVVDTVHCPGSKILGPKDFGAPDVMTKQSMELLAESDALVYLQFAELAGPTGSLVELGIALGRKMRVTIFVQEGLDRPLLMNSFERVAARLSMLPNARNYSVQSPDEVVQWLQNGGRHLLGFKRPSTTELLS